MSKQNNVNPDHYKVAGRERNSSVAAKSPQQPRAMNRNIQERFDRRKQQQKKAKSG
jgi:hypothetical protein